MKTFENKKVLFKYKFEFFKFIEVFLKSFLVNIIYFYIMWEQDLH